MHTTLDTIMLPAAPQTFRSMSPTRSYEYPDEPSALEARDRACAASYDAHTDGEDVRAGAVLPTTAWWVHVLTA